MPALTATLSPVRSRTSGTSSSSRCIVRSSGPRRARTMQNSEAPSAAVSAAAASTSSVSRNGVAATLVSNCDDWLQKWQSSGQPPVLAERMPSTSTSGPHHDRRTSWARLARAGTAELGSAARSASSSRVSWRRSSSRASPAALIRVRSEVAVAIRRGYRCTSLADQCPNAAERSRSQDGTRMAKRPKGGPAERTSAAERSGAARKMGPGWRSARREAPPTGGPMDYASMITGTIMGRRLVLSLTKRPAARRT